MSEQVPGLPEQVTPWRVVLVAGGGAMTLPGQRLQLRDWPTARGVAEVVLFTRYDDVGLAAMLPRELVLEVTCAAGGAEDAVQVARTLAYQLVPLLAFAVNAHIGMPVANLAYEVAPGLQQRRFWQGYVEAEPGLPGVPVVTRRLDEALLFPLLQALLTNPQWEQLARAVSQYAVALSYWTPSARPLALAHLWIALEALGPAAEPILRARLGLADEAAHARHRGVPLNDEHGRTRKQAAWQGQLRTHLLRDVLCEGDTHTFETARDASHGFEHSSMHLPDYAAAAVATSAAMLGYVRRGVLDLLNLDGDVRAQLAAKKALDVRPLQFAVEGVLTGAVGDPDRLSAQGSPYPYADWQVTLDDCHLTADGRHRATSRMNLTARVAEGVRMTWTRHAIGAGLTDPDLLDYEPSHEEPVVVCREDPPDPDFSDPAEQADGADGAEQAQP